MPKGGRVQIPEVDMSKYLKLDLSKYLKVDMFKCLKVDVSKYLKADVSRLVRKQISLEPALSDVSTKLQIYRARIPDGLTTITACAFLSECPFYLVPVHGGCHGA